MKTIKTVEDLKNTKIYIENKEDVINFQERVLNNGVKWEDLCNGIRPNHNIFYISRALKMRVSPTVNEKTMLFFINHKNTQIFLEDVMELKPKFKAFDKVLVRRCRTEEWEPRVFDRLHNKGGFYPYGTICGNFYLYCIPYEENKHLLGTTKDK